MRDEDRIIHAIAISRKSLIELIVVAIVLSFGINLIAGQTLNWLSEKSVIALLIGMLLCLITIVYVLFSLFGSREKSQSYEGFLIEGPAKDNITEIPGYELSEDVHEYLEGAFAENIALLNQWQKSPKGAEKLLSEAIEYYMLHELSFHLEEYFREEGFKDKNIAQYGRTDIPSVLLSNRFLELFSRPMEERAAFALEKRAPFAVASHDGNVVSANGENGAIFNKFDLILPKNSKVLRPRKNTIAIETKKLKLLLTTQYYGYGTILPRNFEQYYLNLPPDVEFTKDGPRTIYSPVEFKVDIRVTVKSRAMFSSSGWEYYRWVDSFLERMESKISRDAFFNRINWEATVTLIECLKHYKPSVLQVKQEQKENISSS